MADDPMDTRALVRIAYEAQAPKDGSGNPIPLVMRPCWALDELARIGWAVAEAAAERCAQIVTDQAGLDPGMRQRIVDTIRSKFSKG